VSIDSRPEAPDGQIRATLDGRHIAETIAVLTHVPSAGELGQRQGISGLIYQELKHGRDLMTDACRLGREQPFQLDDPLAGDRARIDLRQLVLAALLPPRLRTALYVRREHGLSNRFH